MMKRYINYSYKTDEPSKSADIHIYGQIGVDEAFWDEGTNNTAYALVSLIKRLDKTYERINVHINSPGGYIEDGLAIFNTLKACNADIHTYNSGLVASMAGILMLAGTTHYPTTSIHHIHRASTFCAGNVNDFEAEIEALKVFESTLITAISEKTKLSAEDIQQKWFDGKDHYMTAESAKEFGFVDVLENEIKADPPANMDVLEKMNFKDLLDLYENDHEPKKDSFLNKMRKLFLNTNTNSNLNQNFMKTLKTGVTALLAVFALTEFKLNAENNIEISIDDALKLNEKLSASESLIAEQTSQIENLNTTVEDLQTQISDLNAKLANKPVDDADPKGDDINNDPKFDIDDEVSSKLHAYNRKEGKY